EVLLVQGERGVAGLACWDDWQVARVGLVEQDLGRDMVPCLGRTGAIRAPAGLTRVRVVAQLVQVPNPPTGRWSSSRSTPPSGPEAGLGPSRRGSAGRA